MLEHNEHIDELIAKYLAGEALPEEAMQLEDWKNATSSNHDYYLEAERTYLLAHHLPEARTIDTYQLFNEIKQQLQVPVKKEAKVFRLSDYLTPFRAIAAVLIVVLGVVISLYLDKSTNDELAVYESGNTTRVQKLEDGTEVQLQAHSRLELILAHGNERRMRLTGEAGFNVVHNEAKPLVIEANGISIQDIGTIFKVVALPASDSVWVHVSEGVVNMFTHADSLLLEANESGVFIRSQQKIVSLSSLQKASANKNFHFNSTTLEEVVAQLNAVYPEQIQLANADLKKCRITVDFENQPLEVIVTILSETLGLRYEKINSGYRISGKACVQ